MKTELIVALDMEYNEANEMVKLLKDTVKYYKIGPVFFMKYGIKAIEMVNKYEGKVFLDLKLHDIPNTVKQAIENANSLDIYSISVHLLGGPLMLKAAINSSKKIKIWGVTILTSLDLIEFNKIGFRYSLQKQVHHLAKMAMESGIDGVISSPQELYYLRNTLSKELKIITPSIRLSEKYENDDQKRFLTPKEAKDLGASFIVVGRPIIQAKDPLKSAQSILEQIK
jgi:orotidine-5'-phosphate decarboxylase